MPAVQHIQPRRTGAIGAIKNFFSDLAAELDSLSVTRKISAVVALLAVVMTLLAAISIYSTRLQAEHHLASWYSALLGLGGVLLTVVTLVVVRRSVIRPLQEIAGAIDAIAAGKADIAIPHVALTDEIGHLARAVRNFRDAASRKFELELGTAKARDTAVDERDRFSDKYNATKWQLSAAINCMAQGIIMLDARTNVLAINDQYRQIYGLPPEIKAGSALQDILQHRVENGLFTGNVEEYLAAIKARIAKRLPSSAEIRLSDGRLISIHERAMDGGGWVALHEDITEQRRSERILERTEQFLATVVENIAEGIVAKDARSLRYVFVNSAAEAIMGLSRAELVGRTARELFAPDIAELIERRDRQLLEQNQQLEAIVDTIDSPARGRRTIAVRRLQLGGPDREAHVLVSMIEDRSGQAKTEVAGRLSAQGAG